ncbi:MAG: hypothetical protein ACYDAL_10755 [Candidatus Dormibacteraceae bacterium]
MGASADEIDRQIKEVRQHIDENLGVLEQRATSNAVRYGKIAAVVVGVAVMAGAGVLIYRRISRPTRTEQLRSILVDALKELPNALRDLPEDVANKVKRPLPSIKIVVNSEDEAKEPGTLESIVRRVAPAQVGTASSAVFGRFTRSSDPEDAPSRSAVHAYD